MPITKSAKKALRQSDRRRVFNLKRLRTYRNTVKELKKLVADKKLTEAKALLPKVYKTVDKATKRGVIKANKAARIKSTAANWLAAK